MNKIVCFDLDGVLVAEHERFSTRLIEKQGEEIRDAVNEYFSTYFGLVMTGKASLRDTIAPYLTKFNWNGDTSSLLKYWFDAEKTPMLPVLELARDLKDSGIPTYIITDNPAERTNELWKELLADYFTGKYVSSETGLTKSNTALWVRVAKETGTSTKDIFFVDDDIENVNIAASAGVKAVLFSDPEKLKKSIEQFVL